jgi:hypothetical protein
MCGINGVFAHHAPLAGEPKGLVSRSWSRVVLPSVMSANENAKIEALVS